MWKFRLNHIVFFCSHGLFPCECLDLSGQIGYSLSLDCIRENPCSDLPKSGFILERNMHFVVANIVTPLTQSREVSFVTLWGGRRVKYFVSLGICSAKCLLNCFLFDVCAPSVQAAESLPCVWVKVSFLGHQFSALRAFHPMPCYVQRGLHFLD